MLAVGALSLSPHRAVDFVRCPARGRAARALTLHLQYHSACRPAWLDGALGCWYMRYVHILKT